MPGRLHSGQRGPSPWVTQRRGHSPGQAASAAASLRRQTGYLRGCRDHGGEWGWQGQWPGRRVRGTTRSPSRGPRGRGHGGCGSWCPSKTSLPQTPGLVRVAPTAQRQSGPGGTMPALKSSRPAGRGATAGAPVQPRAAWGKAGTGSGRVWSEKGTTVRKEGRGQKHAQPALPPKTARRCPPPRPHALAAERGR